MNTTKLYYKKYTIWEQKHPIFLLQKENYQKVVLISLIVLLHNASTLQTYYVTKNQNVPIVTLVQNALSQVQRILHQCNNWYIFICEKNMQNALIWYKHQNVPIVTLVQNALSLYNAKCNNIIKSEN